MSDSQFSNMLDWIGERIGNFFSAVGSSFSEITTMHWFGMMIMAVVIGFLCMKGLGANQRM